MTLSRRFSISLKKNIHGRHNFWTRFSLSTSLIFTSPYPPPLSLLSFSAGLRRRRSSHRSWRFPSARRQKLSKLFSSDYGRLPTMVYPELWDGSSPYPLFYFIYLFFFPYDITRYDIMSTVAKEKETQHTDVNEMKRRVSFSVVVKGGGKWGHPFSLKSFFFSKCTRDLKREPLQTSTNTVETYRGADIFSMDTYAMMISGRVSFDLFQKGKTVACSTFPVRPLESKEKVK